MYFEIYWKFCDFEKLIENWSKNSSKTNRKFDRKLIEKLIENSSKTNRKFDRKLIEKLIEHSSKTNRKFDRKLFDFESNRKIFASINLYH